MPDASQQQTISIEAVQAISHELGETRLLLADARVTIAKQARRIADLEAPSPLATLAGARERRKEQQPSSGSAAVVAAMDADSKRNRLLRPPPSAAPAAPAQEA